MAITNWQDFIAADEPPQIDWSEFEPVESPATPANLSRYAEPTDEFGIGEEVRGVYRGVKRGGRRFVQAGDIGRLGAVQDYQKQIDETQRNLDTFLAESDPRAKESRWALDQTSKIAQLKGEQEDFKRNAPEFAASFSKQQTEIDKLKPTRAQEEYQKPETSALSFFKNPVELAAVTTAESLPNMALAMAGAPAGPAGVAIMSGSGSFGAESAGRITSAMQQDGVDLKDPKAVMAWFSDTAKSDPQIAKARLAALGPATFDAMTGGLAGQILKRSLGKGLRKVAGATAAEIALQMAGGAAGSITGSKLVNEPIDWKDVILEVAGEIAPGEAVSNVVSERGRGKIRSSLRRTLPITEQQEVENENRQSTSVGVPPRQPAESVPPNAEGSAGEIPQPAAVPPQAQPIEAEVARQITPAEIGREIGFEFNPTSQIGAIRTEGLTLEQRAELEAAMPKQWEFTDRRPDSPTAGLTFYVPEGSTREVVVQRLQEKLAEARSAKKQTGSPGVALGAPLTAPVSGEQSPALSLGVAGELRPALRTTEGQILPGEKGKTHKDIYDALGSIEGNMLRLEQPEHGFLRGNEFLSRAQAAAIVGEKEPLQSERLLKLQERPTSATQPETKPAAPVATPTPATPVGVTKPVSTKTEKELLSSVSNQSNRRPYVPLESIELDALVKSGDVHGKGKRKGKLTEQGQNKLAEYARQERVAANEEYRAAMEEPTPAAAPAQKPNLDPKSPLTPMMQQYQRIKESLSKEGHGNPLLAFRLGDFYEFFFDDAKQAAKLLKLALTNRNGVDMAGIPFHAAEKYFKQLTDQGVQVAVTDVVGEVAPGKPAQRRVTEIISPAQKPTAPASDVVAKPTPEATPEGNIAERASTSIEGGKNEPDSPRKFVYAKDQPVRDVRAIDTLVRVLARQYSLTPDQSAELAQIKRVEPMDQAASDPNGNVAGLEARAWAAIARVFNQHIIFVDFGKNPLNIDGVSVDIVSDTIFLNARSNRALSSLVGHELLHNIRNKNPELYKELWEKLSVLVKRGEFNEYYHRKKASVERSGGTIANNKIGEEFVAELFHDSFQDKAFWDKLAAKEPSLFRKLAITVLEFLNNLIAKLRNDGAYQYFTDISKAHDAIAETLAEFVRQQGGSASSTESGSVSLSVQQALYQFYSRLTRTVEQSQQGKATGAQWKATIRNSKLGANLDEMALVGVNDLEDGKVYTKAEVLDYLKANEVVVKDVTLGASDLTRRLNQEETDYQDGDEMFDVVDSTGRVRYTGGADDSAAYIAHDQRAGRIEKPTHFATYQLPGSKEGSYREVLLTVTSREEFNPWKVEITRHRQSTTQGTVSIKYNGQDFGTWADDGSVETNWLRPEKELVEMARGLWEKGDRDGKYQGKGNWHDGHSQYQDVLNPVVRLRYNERTTSDGKRLLFLEEVQAPQKGQFEKMPALFQKNWREIAFKWALKHAAENGFDSVGWTTGEQQSARYDLSKQVDKIVWGRGGYNADPMLDGFSIQAFKDGNRAIERSGVKGSDLESLVGKEMASKILTESATRHGGSLEGVDLKVGGQGLIKLYDSDFRNVVNNLPAVKKAGQKVGTAEIQSDFVRTFDGRDVSLDSFYTKLQSIRGPWENPATRTAEGWQRWNVSLDKQADGVLNAMRRGDAYSVAMQQHGTQALADVFGGTFGRDERAQQIHSLEITEPIRESVMGGQATFSLTQESTGTTIDPATGDREIREGEAFKSLGELSDELGIIKPEEGEEGVPTKVGDVYDMVLSRPGLNFAVREDSVANAQNALAEAGLIAERGDDGLFRLSDEFTQQEVEGQRLVTILEREIQSARAANRPERISNLLNTVVVHLARDKNQSFSQALKNKLYALAQGERSSFGRALGGLAMWGKVLARIAQNPALHLNRLYSDMYGGELVRKIMDKIASNFGEPFNGEEIERLYNNNPKLQELFDKVVNRLKVKPSLREVIQEIFNTPIYRQDDLVEKFVDTMVNKFSATPDEASRLKTEFNNTFAASFKAARQKALDKALKDLTPQEAKAIGSGTPLWDKIRNLVNAGGFDPGSILQQRAREAGWTVPTEKEMAQMRGWAAKEQLLREPTQRQIDAETGTDAEKLSKATKKAEVGTESERLALIKKIQANWSRWTMPISWKPWHWSAPVARARAKAINEFVGANLLWKVGFAVRQWIDVGLVSMPLNAANRTLVHVLERAENDGGFSATTIKDLDAATREMAVARISSFTKMLRQAERTLTGHTNRRVLDRMTSSIGIFERMMAKADALEAKGNMAGARAVRLATILQAGYRIAATWDAIQSVGLEWQEMRQQLSTEFRKQGKPQAAINIELDGIFGGLKIDMLQAMEEARLIGLERGLTKDKATLQQDAWNLIKAKAYDRMRAAANTTTDYAAENEQYRELHSWNLPETGGIGGVIAGGIRAIKTKTEEMGVPTGGLLSFGNAMGIAANRIATFSGGGLFGGFGFGDSPWYQGERNVRQRRIEAVQGLAAIGILVGLAAAGKILVQIKYPEDKDEKEKFIAEGHKLNTIKFISDDGKWIEYPIQMSPFSFIASPLYMIGGVQALLTKQHREQERLNEEAKRTGTTPGKAKAVDARDVAGVVAQGMYGLMTGGRTASGAIQSFSDYGDFNLNKSTARLVSPYLPGIPAWQEASRAMGAAIDTRTATMLELLTPSPWSGHQRVNSLGDPMVNPNDAVRVLQVMTGGVGFGSDKDLKDNHAYQQLFSAGYATPDVGRGKGYNFDGTIRPMTPQELEKYTLARGKAFKQELQGVDVSGLTPKAAKAIVQSAFQRANTTALNEIGASSPSRSSASAPVISLPADSPLPRSNIPRASTGRARAAIGRMSAPARVSSGRARSRVRLASMKLPRLSTGRARRGVRTRIGRVTGRARARASRSFRPPRTRRPRFAFQMI